MGIFYKIVMLEDWWDEIAAQRDDDYAMILMLFDRPTSSLINQIRGSLRNWLSMVGDLITGCMN